MTNPILYVILNNELNMSPGKAAAQAVHAAMMLKGKQRTDFMSDYRRTVVVLGAKNREQLMGIGDYLYEAKIDYEYYVDEGVNEVGAFSTTALAVAPFDSGDSKREIFAGLELYGSYEEQEDDCCNYTESEQTAVNRTVFDIQRQLGNLSIAVAKAVEVEPPKLKWYQRFFKRKYEQSEFVS